MFWLSSFAALRFVLVSVVYLFLDLCDLCWLSSDNRFGDVGHFCGVIPFHDGQSVPICFPTVCLLFPCDLLMLDSAGSPVHHSFESVSAV